MMWKKRTESTETPKQPETADSGVPLCIREPYDGNRKHDFHHVNQTTLQPNGAIIHTPWIYCDRCGYTKKVCE